MWRFYCSLEIEVFQVKNIFLNDSVKVLVLSLKVAFFTHLSAVECIKATLEPVSN